MSASMLRHYELDDESMMKINVFDFVITRIFSQFAEIDDQWRSIVFYFKKMIFVERNYKINDQEILVIVKICKKWRHYIKSVKYSVWMIIDHVNLKNFFINKLLSRREVRWWKRLTELDLKIKYRFDKNNFANDSFHKRNYENEIANEDKNNENLNFRKWILIESKNIFTNKNEKKKNTYFFQSTSHRYAVLSNANNNSSKILEIIDETSKNNCLTKNNFEKSAKISIVKNAQNFLKKKKIVAIVKRALKRKKFFKSSFQDIEKISKKFRFENIANNENLVLKDWIKNVLSKKATFNASFLKLRIILFILQQSDSFAQRVRFFVEKSSMKHDKENENAKRSDSNKDDDVTSNESRKNVDLNSFFKWNIENDLLRWKNKWYIFSKFFKRKLLKQNHDDSYVDHFEHEKIFDLLRKKYFWNNMNKKIKKYVDICSTCHRSIKKSCTTRCWWWSIVISNSICTFHQNMKCWKFDERINRWDLYQIRKTRLYYHKSGFSFFFKFWSLLCYHLRMRLRYNIVYHSQIDEQIERQNQTFESYLRNYVNYQQNDWIKWFNIIEYVYNNNLNNVLKQTLFRMMFDSKMKFENVIQKDFKIDVFAARNRVVHVSKMRRVCEARWKQILKKTKRNYNKKKFKSSLK
jgi:hypothetical protein